jgi:hypothetical protein
MVIVAHQTALHMVKEALHNYRFYKTMITGINWDSKMCETIY